MKKQEELSFEAEERRNYLIAQADALGMESLTESEQYLVLYGKEVEE